MHHADAKFDGVFRPGDLNGRAIHQDLAFVRFVQSVDHVHQRAFAGAVLAQQAEDLALAQGQINSVIRQDAGEALANAPNFQHGRGFAHGRAFWLVELRKICPRL